MIKGHCEIILSENGKEIMHTHDDNIVTNAIPNWFNLPQKWWLSNSNLKYAYAERTPIYQNFIGGVVLLKHAIEGTDEELKEKTFLPIGQANITGHAGRNTDYNAEDLALGVYNPTESHEVENGFQYVWDFSTETGNGDIYSVCLTSDRAGQSVPMYTSGGGLSNDLFRGLGRYSKISSSSNDLCFGITSDGRIVILNGKTLKTANLDFPIGLFERKKSDSYEDSTAFVNYPTYTEYTLPIDTDSDHLQWTDEGLADLHGSTLTIFSEENWQVKSVYEFGVPTTGTRLNFYVKNKYCYIFLYGQPRVLKVNLNDLSDRVILEFPESNTGSFRFAGEIGDKMIIVGSSRIYLFDGFNFSKPTGFSSEDVRYRYFPIPNAKAYSVRGGLYQDIHNGYFQLYYLDLPMITIDNLETPVTKTNAQTMKVIYTVTEADETEGGEETA